VIKSLWMDGFRGVNKTVTLDRLNLLVGPNGSGKSAVIDMLWFLVTGAIPKCGKLASDLFANASTGAMRGSLALDDGTVVERSLFRHNDSISSSFSVNGVAGKRGGDSAVQVALSGKLSLFHADEFFALSDRAKMLRLLELSGEKQAAKLISDEEAARKALSAARQQEKKDRALVEKLSSDLSVLESVSGTMERVDADLAQARGQLLSLEKSLADPEKVREQSDKLANLQLEATTIDSEALLLPDVDALGAEYSRLCEEAAKIGEQLAAASAGSLQQADFDELLAALEATKTMVTDAGLAEHFILHHLHKLVERWRSRVAIDKSLLAALDADLAKLESAQVVAGAKLSDARNRAVNIAIRREKVSAEIERIQKYLAAVSESGPNDAALAIGLREAIATLDAKRLALVRRKTVSDQIERARIALKQSASNTEKASAAADRAADALAKRVSKMVSDIGEAATGYLTDGKAAIGVGMDGDIHIGWERLGVVVDRDVLSGGERVIFDAAIGRALHGASCLLLLDAGECSNQTLIAVMQKLLLSDSGCQAILARWTDDTVSIPAIDGWNVIDMGAA